MKHADVAIIIPSLLADKKRISECIEGVLSNNSALDSWTINVVIKHGSFAKACNAGALSARAKWLLFLNDDILFINADNYIYRMIKYCEKHQYYVCGARLLNPDQTWHHVGVWFDKNLNPSIRYAGVKSDKYPTQEPHAVIGAFLLIEYNTFFLCGAFDPVYQNGYEDIDFCLKARQNNYRIGIFGEPSDIIIHHEHTTIKTIKNFPDLVRQNREYFYKKWSKEKIRRLLNIR